MLLDLLEQLVRFLCVLDAHQHRRRRWLRIGRRNADHHHVVLAHSAGRHRFGQQNVEQNVAQIRVGTHEHLRFLAVVRGFDEQLADAPVDELAAGFDEDLAALREEAVLLDDGRELVLGRFFVVVVDGWSAAAAGRWASDVGEAEGSAGAGGTGAKSTEAEPGRCCCCR